MAQQDAPQPPGRPNPQPDPPDEEPGEVDGPPPEDTEHDRHKPGRDPAATMLRASTRGPLRTSRVHRASG